MMFVNIGLFLLYIGYLLIYFSLDGNISKKRIGGITFMNFLDYQISYCKKKNKNEI